MAAWVWGLRENGLCLMGSKSFVSSYSVKDPTKGNTNPTQHPRAHCASGSGKGPDIHLHTAAARMLARA